MRLCAFGNEFMTSNLFEDMEPAATRRDELGCGALVLRGFALPHQAGIFTLLQSITADAPFRHMVTPGGFRMSVAMTNCGEFGWVTDRRGYRYERSDSESGKRWTRMPAEFSELAQDAARNAGFKDFSPDACLINRYGPGARMSLHQDRDEHDFNQPIVSLSFGIPAVFLFGGLRREDKPMRIPLTHGDVVVWGGPSRLRYHGVMPLKEGHHPLTGVHRINLTFRKAA
jgi:alkylated DNA repair protein (DNA oxidative demethylase)